MTAWVALLALFLAFRLTTQSPAASLLIFVPVAAIGLIPADVVGPVHNAAGYFAVMPMRYAGPLFSFLTLAAFARWPRSRSAPAVLGFVTVATVINNVDFGVPTLIAVATGVGILGATTGASKGLLRNWASGLAAGGLAMAALFAGLTALVSGSLPNLANLFYFPRLFAGAGVSMLPLGSPVSLYGLVFLTFAASFLVSVWPLLTGLRGNVTAGSPSAVTSAMLGFSGVFGFGVLAYYVGRSHPAVLYAVFLAWAIALGLLSITGARSLLRFGSGHILAAAVIAFFAFLGVGSIVNNAQTVQQVDRLFKRGGGSVDLQSAGIEFARNCVASGTRTIVFLPFGQRVASAAGLKDFMPFNHPETVSSLQQIRDLEGTMRRNKVDVFVGPTKLGKRKPELARMLQGRGLLEVRRRSFNTIAGESSLAIWARPGSPSIRCADSGIDNRSDRRR